MQLANVGVVENQISEHKIVGDAHSVLVKSNYPAVRRIRCEFREGKLTLLGRVGSYHEKQVAQTLVLPLIKGIALDNRLQVAGMQSRLHVRFQLTA